MFIALVALSATLWSIAWLSIEPSDKADVVGKSSVSNISETRLKRRANSIYFVIHCLFEMQTDRKEPGYLGCQFTCYPRITGVTKPAGAPCQIHESTTMHNEKTNLELVLLNDPLFYVLLDFPNDRQHGDVSFASSGGRANEEVLVCVVRSLKNYRLDPVQMLHPTKRHLTNLNTAFTSCNLRAYIDYSGYSLS